MRLPHLPGAVEPPLARRRRLRAERRTWALAVAALGAGGALAVSEVLRVWHRGSAPLLAHTDDVAAAGAEHVPWTTAPQHLTRDPQDDFIKDWEVRARPRCSPGCATAS